MDKFVGLLGSPDHNENCRSTDSPCSFPSCTLYGEVVEVYASNMTPTKIFTEEVMRKRNVLLGAISLDEYIGSREGQLKGDAKVDYRISHS